MKIKLSSIFTDFFVFVLLVVALSPFVLFAQTQTAPPPSIDYQMLAPIPQLGASSDGNTTVTNIQTFIPQAIKLLIGFAGAAAVFRIMYGGWLYMSSEAFGKKSDAKKVMTNAVIGLILTLGAYTIIYTINPELVKVNLNLEPVGSGEAIDVDLGTGPTFEEQDGTVIGLNVAGAGQPFCVNNLCTDTTTRDSFAKLGITVNASECKKVGQRNCTSLLGMSRSVTDGLIAIKQACNCAMVITGGTEYWLHATHGPGKNVVDLRKTDLLTSYIEKNGKKANGGSCSKGPAYTVPGAPGLYVDEQISGNAPHWHVCY